MSKKRVNYGQHIIISKDIHRDIKSICAEHGWAVCDVADGTLREEVESLKKLQNWDDVHKRIEHLALRSRVRPKEVIVAETEHAETTKEYLTPINPEVQIVDRVQPGSDVHVPPPQTEVGKEEN